MFVQQLTLRQFRCFKERSFTIDAPVVIVEGPNGSGKSSLLEAIHYCCYLRSFRTHLHRNLVQIGENYFFINVVFDQNQGATFDQVQVGFSERDGKVVKFNQKKVQSYRELVSLFRTITLSADDLALVHGSPQLRRDFLNYALLVLDVQMLPVFRRYKSILEHRNSLLNVAFGATSEEELEVWTKKLWDESLIIRRKRIEYLEKLEKGVNRLLKKYFNDTGGCLKVSFSYTSKNIYKDQDFDKFWSGFKKNYLSMERRLQRTLFGIHLDDFSIVFQNKRAKVFASRGQQKLLVLLIKIAQMQQLSLLGGERGVLLLDDFVTDFDAKKIEQCVHVLKDQDFQMFLSCPSGSEAIAKYFTPKNVGLISLD